MQGVRAWLLVGLVTQMLAAPMPASGQESRRGGGVRVGAWNVDVAPWVERSVDVEAYIQRALGSDLALENSLSAWRAVVNQTRAYVVPLFTSLKFYPADPGRRIDPFVAGGVGLAFGIQDEPDNAIGGTGTTIVTGVALRAGVGVEVRVFRGLGVAGTGKYQWIRFGDRVGTMQTFTGVGWAGAVTYRFRQ